MSLDKEEFDFEETELADEMQELSNTPHDNAELTFDLREELHEQLNDITANNQEEDENEEQNSEQETKASKNNLWIIIAAIAFLAIIGGFVYVASIVLSPKGSASIPQAFPEVQDTVQADTANADGASAILKSGNQFAEQLNSAPVHEVTPALSVETTSNSPTKYERSNKDDKTDPLLITEGDAAVPSEATAQEQQTGRLSVSDEEHMYDNLLSQASSVDAPPEAIKIDQSVITQKIESQRVSALASELATARQSIDGIRSAVSEMQNNVAGLGKIVEAGALTQQKAIEQVEALASSVKAAQEAQKTDLKEIRAMVEKANGVAKAALVESTKPKEEVAKVVATAVIPVAAPVREQVVQQPLIRQPIEAQQARPVQVAQAPEIKPRAVISSQEPRNTTPQCNGAVISEVWRVKGVNTFSAYIVRSEDKAGVYLKKDVSVPGFGVVVGFDPVSRSVCTTVGLIKR